MELSPLARQKLAKIGELSPEEKEEFRKSEELASLLSDYFTDKLSIDGLWLKLKHFKEEGKDFLIKEAQLRLIYALGLGINAIDFERFRDGILGCETLKESSRYAELESALNSVEDLRRQYQQNKDEAFNSLKDGIKGQVEMAAQQMAKQAGNRKVPVDIQSSIEASVKASPQWRDFMLKHEKSYSQRFNDYLSKLKALVY